MKRSDDLVDTMSFFSFWSFVASAGLLLAAGADPADITDAISNLSEKVLGQELNLQEGTSGQNIDGIVDRLVNIVVDGGWALGGALAFFWRRIQTIGLMILGGASGRGLTTNVPVEWASDLGAIGQAGIFVMAISAMTAGVGLVGVFRR
ncbi:MAG: hypothetical protein AAF788_05790 [Pseudomonadota bacterium]